MAAMRYAHSTRSTRRAPRISSDYEGVCGFSFGYDGSDMRELDRLIAAKVKTPRAEMEQRKETVSARRAGR